MMTYTGISSLISTVSRLYAQTTGTVSSLSQSETNALAIGQTAEMNIIQPRTQGTGLLNRQTQGIGLTQDATRNLANAGLLIAMKQAAGSEALGSIVSQDI